MSHDVIGYVIGGMFALLAALLAARSTARANLQVVAMKKEIAELTATNDADRIEGEAYSRARATNIEIVSSLTTELTRLRTRVIDAEAKVGDLTDALDAALTRAHTAEQRAEVYKAQAEARYPDTDPEVNRDRRREART